MDDEAYDELSVRLIAYADSQLWWLAYNQRREVSVANGEISIDGKSAADFAQESFAAYAEGRRNWNRKAYPTFLEFLCSVVDSLISNTLKHASGHRSIDDPIFAESKLGADLLSTYPPPDEALMSKEKALKENRFWKEFVASLNGEDTEILKLIHGLECGESKPQLLADLTGIDARRISELGRKLKVKMQRFFLKNKKRFL